MRTHRTQDFYRTKTDKERLYYAAGIPWRFWTHAAGAPSFRTATWGRGSIAANTQQKWFDRLWDREFLGKPYLFVFASEPTDEMALAQTFQFCKRVMRSPTVDGRLRRVNIVTAQTDLHLGNRQDVCDVHVIHNVMAKSDSLRTTLVRDWVLRHDDAMRIVVVAGTPDDFRCSYRVEPNGIFLFGADSILRATRSFG